MKILSRYLFFNLLKPLIYLMVLFTLLFVVADLMDNSTEFFKAKTPIVSLLGYYALRLPTMVIMIVPVCLLLAVLYSLSSLTRHNEITAMRASGISIYWVLYPYLLMGFFCFLFTALVNEYTAPHFAYRADQFVDYQSSGDESVYFKQVAFRNPQSNHIWLVHRFDTRSYSMEGVELIHQRTDGTDWMKYTAEKARWLDGRWWFEDGMIQKYDEQGNLSGPPESFQVREMRNLSERPSDFMRELKDPAFQSSSELWRYIRTHYFLSPETLVKYKVDFHHRLSMPVVCLVIVLIGIPVGSHTGRRGALAGIMLALLMFFGFYATQFIMEYLAKQMLIPAWLGPWGSVILFSALGGIMIHRMR